MYFGKDELGLNDNQLLSTEEDDTKTKSEIEKFWMAVRRRRSVNLIQGKKVVYCTPDLHS